MRNKIIYILILFTFCVSLYFYYSSKPTTHTKCPESYPETDTGFKEQKTDTDKWITDFKANNPNASLSELAKTRYTFYVENNCMTTIQKYSEMEEYEGETEQEKIMRITIQEEIQNQSMENLTNALKNDKQKQ